MLQLGSSIYIKKDGNKNKYQYTSSSTHIEKNSPILPVFHNLWRQKAILSASQASAEHLHFTNVQTISEVDYQKLKSLLLAFIKECSHTATQSGSDDVFVLNCDLFKP
jgi:hypothetical protein